MDEKFEKRSLLDRSKGMDFVSNETAFGKAETRVVLGSQHNRPGPKPGSHPAQAAKKEKKKIPTRYVM